MVVSSILIWYTREYKSNIKRIQLKFCLLIVVSWSDLGVANIWNCDKIDLLQCLVVVAKYYVVYKQVEEADLPPAPEVTDTTDTKLHTRQFMITTGAAQENADNAKATGDANHQMFEDHVGQLGDQLKAQLVGNCFHLLLHAYVFIFLVLLLLMTLLAII